MTVGLLLYGAPASGKDTVTAALEARDPRFRLYQRLKSGPGRTAGYRMSDAATLDQLAAAGAIVWENVRYGSRYAIDEPTLTTMIADGVVPVVHAGQPELVDAVRSSLPQANWFVVELRSSREIAQARIIARETGDVRERLSAWDTTPSLSTAMLSIDTGQVAEETSAALICALLDGGSRHNRRIE